MKLISFVLFLGLHSIAYAQFDNTITLTSKNFVYLSGEINEQSIQATILKLVALDDITPLSKPLYLVLNTSGGYTEHGIKLITRATTLNHQVKTITVKAISMGFFIAQFLDERLIKENGIMLAHRIRYADFRGNPVSLVPRNTPYVYILESTSAARMNTTLRIYYQKTKNYNEWKAENGTEAVTLNMADRIVKIRCSKQAKSELKEICDY